MLIDVTTYKDLSIFQGEDEYSVFSKLNFTNTVEGREQLLKFFKTPLKDIKEITQVQNIVRKMSRLMADWPTQISNGTLMVLVKFYESNLDSIPRGSVVSSYNYRLFNSADYAILRFSVEHFIRFVKGMYQLIAMAKQSDLPHPAAHYIALAESILRKPAFVEVFKVNEDQKLSITDNTYFGKFFKEEARADIFQLIAIFGKFDAWYSMAKAQEHYQLVLPEFIESDKPELEVEGLFHILLDNPVSYNVNLNQKSNFIFLTGANMAGKSTFIRAVGISVYLAHLGMGIPAASAKMSVFNGLLSNINVLDNIFKGESYFFNEVQRIKNTITKVMSGNKWLVLIDELFKGTNVEDAVRCSTTVIKGLVKIDQSLFILSTHLYEIANELKEYDNISFRYFETNINGEQLEFSYKLKEGVSKDRLGYLILNREGVVDLLNNI
ncbi:MutS-related protein [Gynurincola endophyticus]|uniref:MutS-related protein n=1 Tax=Gynurincola endophyticus TaxID=2479004 RepID=UPI000F8F47DF|nr:DNA mismatch repair protein MutS [Gynurincola endophyticus]